MRVENINNKILIDMARFGPIRNLSGITRDQQLLQDQDIGPQLYLLETYTISYLIS